MQKCVKFTQIHYLRLQFSRDQSTKWMHAEKNLMFGLLIYFGGTGIHVHTNMLMESVNAINKGTIRSHNVVQLLI